MAKDKLFISSKNILQVHIQCLHPDYIMSVAVKTGTKDFLCYYKKTTAIAENDIQKVVKKGMPLSEEKARELFNLPEYSYASEENLTKCR